MCASQLATTTGSPSGRRGRSSSDLCVQHDRLSDEPEQHAGVVPQRRHLEVTCSTHTSASNIIMHRHTMRDAVVPANSDALSGRMMAPVFDSPAADTSRPSGPTKSAGVMVIALLQWTTSRAASVGKSVKSNGCEHRRENSSHTGWQGFETHGSEPHLDDVNRRPMTHTENASWTPAPHHCSGAAQSVPVSASHVPVTSHRPFDTRHDTRRA